VPPDCESEEDVEDETDNVPNLDDMRLEAKKLSNGQRPSVSAEVFGINNTKKEYIAQVVEKPDEAKERIAKR